MRDDGDRLSTVDLPGAADGPYVELSVEPPGGLVRDQLLGIAARQLSPEPRIVREPGRMAETIRVRIGVGGSIHVAPVCLLGDATMPPRYRLVKPAI